MKWGKLSNVSPVC